MNKRSFFKACLLSGLLLLSSGSLRTQTYGHFDLPWMSQGKLPLSHPATAVNTLRDVAAYWKFDALTGSPLTAVDSIGTQNLVDQSIISGHAPSLQTGIIVNAVQEDDAAPLSCQSMAAPDSAVLGAGAGVSFTYSLWVMVQSGGNVSGGRPLLSKGDDPFGPANVCDYCLHHDNAAGGVTLTVVYAPNSTASVNYNATDPLQSPPTGFHHIVCGFDAGSGNLFIQFDNSARLTAAVPGGVVLRSNKALTVFNFSDCSFRGLFRIDEMGLWKRALTTAEVTTLYNGGSAYALSNFYP